MSEVHNAATCVLCQMIDNGLLTAQPHPVTRVPTGPGAGPLPPKAERVLALPTDSQARKKIPLWTFISEYFPKTMVGLASLSFRANEKHNPGQPMHWSREKSGDHKNCIARHLLDEERIDPETGEPEAVAAAWRAMANAELVIERLQARGEYPVYKE